MRFTRRFETVGLGVGERVDEGLVVINPAPGGGRFQAALALNPVIDECLREDGLCVRDLRRDRAPLWMPEGAVGVPLLIAGGVRNGGLRWRGGEEMQIRRPETIEVARVELLQRQVLPTSHAMTWEASGGVVPMPMDLSVVALGAETRGTQPRVVVGYATHRSNGAFHPPVVAAAAPLAAGGVGSVVVDDLNGDGLDDVVLGGCDTRVVEVFAGTGDGGLASIDTEESFGCVLDLAVAEVDGDGRPDVVGGNSESIFSNVVGVWRGTEDGGLRPPFRHTADRRPSGVALGDIDGDGRPDVLLGRQGPPSIRLARADGTLVDEQLLTGDGGIEWDSRGAVARDLDGDGRIDLDISRQEPASVWIWQQSRIGGGELLEPLVLELDAPPEKLAAADLEGDGEVALVAATCSEAGGADEGHVRVAVAPFEAWGPAFDVGGCPHSMEVVDLTGDAVPDLLIGLRLPPEGGAPARAALVRGRAGGGFEPPEILGFGALAGTVNVAVGHLNTDGALDLVGSVVAADGATRLVTRLGLGTPSLPPGFQTVPAPERPRDIVAADLNHDGWPDLITADPAGVAVRLAAPGGADYGAARATPIARGTWTLRVLDLDGDAHLDVVVLSEDRRWLTVLPGDGVGGFGAPRETDLGVCAVDRLCVEEADPPLGQGLRVRDVDHDGVLDVVVGSCDGRVRVLHPEPGTGAFDRSTTLRDDVCPFDFEFGQLDGRWAPVMIAAAPETWLRILIPDGAGDYDDASVLTWVAAVARADGYRGLTNEEIAARVPEALVDAFKYEAYEVDVADLDGDGQDEIVAMQPEPFAAANYWRADPGGRWTLDRMTARLANAWWYERDSVTFGALRSVRHDDLNGDRLPEQIRTETEQIELWTPRTPVFPPTFDRLPAPGVTWPVDLNRNGQVELVATSQSVGLLGLYYLPEPAFWRMQIRDRLEPPTLEPGRSIRVPLTMLRQRVERVAVRVRLESAGYRDPALADDVVPVLGPVRLELEAPDGRVVEIEDGAGPDGRTAWQAAYRPEDVPALAELVGWHPIGNWALRIRNDGAAPVVLRDFTLLPQSWLARPTPGSRADAPQPLAMPPEAEGTVVHADSTGGVDVWDAPCADTRDPDGASPERWFELVLDEPNTVDVALSAAFPGAVAVTAECGDAAALACAAGSDARIEGLALAAGTYCVVVDGATGGHAGPFDLAVRLDAPLPPPQCPPFCEPVEEPDAGVADTGFVPDAGAAGVIACGDEDCDVPQQICCVGFDGPACEDACVGFVVPVRCDGPEDCGAGQDCCGGLAGGLGCVPEAECAALDYELCHRDIECDGVPCLQCNVLGIGDVSLCADICP